MKISSKSFLVLYGIIMFVVMGLTLVIIITSPITDTKYTVVKIHDVNLSGRYIVAMVLVTNNNTKLDTFGIQESLTSTHYLEIPLEDANFIRKSNYNITIEDYRKIIFHSTPIIVPV